MRCLLVNACQVACYICAWTTASCMAAGQDSVSYFPTKVGAKWVYDLDGKDITQEITAVKSRGDNVLVTVLRVDQFGTKREAQIKITKKGLFQLTGGPADIHPPMWLLKLPHRDGAKWETFTGAAGTLASTVTAHGAENIEVHAGKFEAIRTETIYPNKVGPNIVGKEWYAPGIGLVKEVFGEHVKVLKSITPGKD